MTALYLSQHAEARTQQRGLRHEDVHFVCQHGTETAKGYLLTEQDAADLEAEARHLLLKAAGAPSATSSARSRRLVSASTDQ